MIMNKEITLIQTNIMKQIAVQHASIRAVEIPGNIKYILIFASPNARDDLSFQEAVDNLKSRDHQLFKMMSFESASVMGQDVKILDVIGDWHTGVENSLMAILEGSPDPKKVLSLASFQGKIAKQFEVAIFYVLKIRGYDQLLRLLYKGELGLKDIRSILTDNRIKARTLHFYDGGIEIVVCVEGNIHCGSFYSSATALGLKNTDVTKELGEFERISYSSRSSAKRGFGRKMVKHLDEHELSLIREIEQKYSSMKTEGRMSTEHSQLFLPLLSPRSIELIGRIYQNPQMDLNDCYRELGLNNIRLIR